MLRAGNLVLLVASLAVLGACASAQGPSVAGANTPSSQESEGTSQARAQELQPGDEEQGADVFEPGPHPLADDREADPTRALPELTYQHLGMHIGGESNSPESKRPWLEDIERHDEALLKCYRLVDQPERGGSYGVDLYVSKAGGAPEVRGSRQKIGSEEFDRCMREAFGRIQFHQPERPTVFSYSILFKLSDSSQPNE